MNKNDDVDVDSSCQICCKSFTKMKRRRIACSDVHCAFSACQSCVERRVLSTDDPSVRCMTCNTVWTKAHLRRESVGDAFITRIDQHAAKLILTQERSKLPRAQEVLAARDESYRLMDEVDDAADRIRDAQDEVIRCRDAFFDKKRELERVRHNGRVERLVEGDSKFTKWLTKCPHTNCRGFIKYPEHDSPTASCGLCDTTVCLSCGMSVATGDDAAPHVCDPDARASFLAIQNQTHPCPKCHTRTHRIDGCEQMFCTVCHTPWKWSTGEIIAQSHLHNPHYFEFQRAQMQNLMPGSHVAPQGEHGVCNTDLPVSWVTIPHVNESVSATVDGTMRLPPVWGSIVLAFTNLLKVVQPRMTYVRPDEAKEMALANLRLKYLQREIDETQWMSSIRRIMGKAERQTAAYELYNVLLFAGHDLLEIILFESDEAQRLSAVRGIIELGAWFNASSNQHLERGRNNGVPQLVFTEMRMSEGSRTYDVRIDHEDCFRSLLLREDDGTMPRAVNGDFEPKYFPFHRDVDSTIAGLFNRIARHRSFFTHSHVGCLCIELVNSVL